MHQEFALVNKGFDIDRVALGFSGLDQAGGREVARPEDLASIFVHREEARGAWLGDVDVSFIHTV